MNPKKSFLKGFAIAIVAASLMVMSVAAAHYMGAFERLAEIIGPERADELTPLEIRMVVDEQIPPIADEQPPQAVDEFTPQVDDELPPQHDSIGVELVAIELTDFSAYIYFTLEDQANRLDGDFTVMHSLVPTTPIDGFMVIASPHEIIDRDADGVITFRSLFEFNQPFEGLELIYWIQGISFGFFDHPPQAMSINLMDFMAPAPAALLQTYSPAGGADRLYEWCAEAADAQSDMVMRYMIQIMEEGLPILVPHALDIALGIDGVDSRISNIGMINERLHIQIYSPGIRRESVSLFIVHKNDVDMLDDYWEAIRRRIPNLFFTQFRVADIRTPYQDLTGANHSTYIEHIYDIDMEYINMDEYVLAVSVRGQELIIIDWSVTFDLGN